MEKKYRFSTGYISFIFILMIMYVIQDLANSKNVNLIGGDRTIVHILLFMIIIFMALYNFYYDFTEGVTFKHLRVSLLLITLWITFVGIIRNVSFSFLSVHAGLSFLWFVSYNFGRINFKKYDYNNKKIMFRIIIVFLIYVVGAFIAQRTIYSVDGRIPVLNLVYYVMGFFPWIAIMRTNKIKIILNFLILLVLLISFKRGAIVIYFLMLPTYILLKSYVENKKNSGFIKVILMFTTFFIMLIIADNLAGGFLLQRFSQDEVLSGSGRNQLYLTAWNDIKSRSIVDLLIGFGSGSSIVKLGTGIHNEWLEFLYSYGIIGVILYINLLIALLRRFFSLFTLKSRLSPSYASIVVFIVIIGLFDGFYFMHSTLYIMMYLGAIDGIIEGNSLTSALNTL